MLTKTSKQILNTLSDVVEKLINVIEECESKLKPCPDLTILSKSVQDQVKSLSGVADRIINNPKSDLQLKSEMPAACDSAIDAANLLLISSNELLKDPYSTEYKQKLMEAVKELFQGTNLLLTVFDSSDIRKIKNVSEKIQQSIIEIISHSTEPLPQKEFVSRIALVSQSIISISQLCIRRCAELLTEELEIELQSKIAALSLSGPFFVSACKLVLIDRKSPANFEILYVISQQLIKTCKRIEEIVQTNTDEQTINIFDDALAPKDFFSKGRLSLRLSQFIVETKKRFEEYKNISQSLHDNQTLVTTLQRIKETEQCLELFSESIELYLLEPNDVNEEKYLKKWELLNKSDICLKESLNNIVIAELLSTTDQLSLLMPMSPTKDDSLLKFAHLDSKLSWLIDFCIERASEKQLLLLTQEVTLSSEKIKDHKELMLKSFYASNPNQNNPILQSLITETEQRYQSEISQFSILVISQEGLFSNRDLIIGKDNYLKTILEDFKKSCISHDYKSVIKIGLKIFNIGNSLITMISSETSAISNLGLNSPIYQDIKQEFINFKEMINEAQDEGDHANLGNIYHQLEILENMLNAIIKNMVTLMDSKEREKSIKEISECKIASPEKLDIESFDISAPEELLSEEEAILNPIKAAGQDLKIEISNWADTDNPILNAIENVSKQLIEMSKHHIELEKESYKTLKTGQSNSKSMLINTAKTILKESQTIINAAKSLVIECTDKVLSKQLSSSLGKIETLSQQLKIVASVKASSPTDRDKGYQLIQCATNLVLNLKYCLKSCLSASAQYTSLNTYSDRSCQTFSSSDTFMTDNCYPIRKFHITLTSDSLCAMDEIPDDVCNLAITGVPYYGKLSCAQGLSLNVFTDSGCSVPFTTPVYPIPENQCLSSSVMQAGFILKCTDKITGTLATATIAGYGKNPSTSSSSTATATSTRISGNGDLQSGAMDSFVNAQNIILVTLTVVISLLI